MTEAPDRRTYVDFAYTSTDDVFGKSLQTCPWGRSRGLCRPYRWKLARKRQVQIEIPEIYVRTDWRGAEWLWGDKEEDLRGWHAVQLGTWGGECWEEEQGKGARVGS